MRIIQSILQCVFLNLIVLEGDTVFAVPLGARAVLEKSSVCNTFDNDEKECLKFYGPDKLPKDECSNLMQCHAPVSSIRQTQSYYQENKLQNAICKFTSWGQVKYFKDCYYERKNQKCHMRQLKCAEDDQKLSYGQILMKTTDKQWDVVTEMVAGSQVIKWIPDILEEFKQKSQTALQEVQSVLHASDTSIQKRVVLYPLTILFFIRKRNA